MTIAVVAIVVIPDEKNTRRVDTGDGDLDVRPET